MATIARYDWAVPGSVRKFNPGLLETDEEIIRKFVVRHAEFEIVLDVLSGNVGRNSCQHALVVSPRGQGKTMLLARVAAELRTNGKFAESLLPVRFMEESHEIFDIADFWLETLFHVARESIAVFPEIAEELKKTHASLSSRWRERNIGDLARVAVLDAAERMGRRLVLLIENFQAVCANADDDFGWQLRAVLQSEPRIMLLASATSRFHGLKDAGEPFFEFFRIVELKALGTKQCRRLWEANCVHARRMDDIRPLEILTGGNPRLLVIVAGVVRHGSIRQLMEELVTLIDEHTEYFRGHLEVLPKLERRVYVAVIDLWRPSSAGEIADRARMDVRTASTMLGRLLNRGAVTRIDGEDRRKRLYSAAEPLYSIYYKLRRERDEAAVVENLILFMMAFYNSFDTIYELWDVLQAEAIESVTVRSGIERALTRRPAGLDGHARIMWNRLERVSRAASSERYVEASIRLDEEIESAFASGNAVRVIELVDRYTTEGWDRSPTAIEDRETAYLGHLRAEAYLRLKEFEEAVAIGTELIERLRSSPDEFVQWRCALLLLCQTRAYSRLGDFDGVLASARGYVNWFGQRDDSQWGPLLADALVLMAESHYKLGREDAAATLLDDIVRRFGDREEAAFGFSVAVALFRRADIEWDGGRSVETVVSLYDRAVECARAVDVEGLGGPIAATYLNRAFLQAKQRDFEGEIDSYGEVVDLFGDKESFAAEVSLAIAFASLRQAEIGNESEALRGCADLERRVEGSSGAWACLVRGLALGARAIVLTKARHPAAIEAFATALAEFPARNQFSMRTIARLTLNLIAAGADERDLVNAIASDHELATAVAPLLSMLRERCGEPMRMPAELRSVTDDIHKRLEDHADLGHPGGF